VFGGAAKNASADRVEGPAPHALRLLTEQARDSLPHLAGRLVGERHGEDARRIHTVVLDEPRDACRENAGFAGARSREHQHGSLEV